MPRIIWKPACGKKRLGIRQRAPSLIPMRGQATKTTRAGDSRSPGQPPDLHEEGMVPVPIGIAPISRASPESHVKTTHAGDSRPPGQPPDVHEEGMVPVPIGIAPISRASPEGDNTVPVPIGIAPISRASPEGDNLDMSVTVTKRR